MIIKRILVNRIVEVNNAQSVAAVRNDPTVQYLYLANEGIVALLLEVKSFIKFIELMPINGKLLHTWVQLKF